MLPSVHRNVDELIQAGLEYRSELCCNCTKRPGASIRGNMVTWH